MMSLSPVGTVTLNVAHLEPMLLFYTDIIGLREHNRVDAESGQIVYLGAGGDDLLALVEYQGQQYRNVTGLYHFALRVPTRHDLAQSLARLMQFRTPLQGASDHIVSEAVYLADPEGNGIEIYYDRPREQWFDDAGRLQMDTRPLDVEGVLRELQQRPVEWRGIAPDTDMGHIHLHVRDIPEAQRFYTELIGLDLMFNVGSALFLSYEGYHHHIGANIWGGRVERPDDAYGLDHFDLYVEPGRVEHLFTVFTQANIPVIRTADGIRFRDPSGIGIHLRARS